jgi:tetratricopeptide (TPR) repeat protein
VLAACLWDAPDDPIAALRVAYAAYYGTPRRCDAVGAVAARVASEPGAQLLAGLCALDDNDETAAVAHFVAADAQYAARRDAAGRSRVVQQLAGLHASHANWGAELDAAQLALDLAGTDEAARLYALVARGDAYRSLGVLGAAADALDLALGVAENTSDDDRATVRFKRAMVASERGDDDLAAVDLDWVEAAVGRGAAPFLADAVLLNLARLDIGQRHFTEALAKIDRAQAIARPDVAEALLRAKVFDAAGRFAEARGAIAEAFAFGPTGEPSFGVPVEAAHIALRSGHPAEAAAYNSLAIVAANLFADSARDFAPSVIASCSEPYLQLVGMFAAHHAWPEALEIVAELDERAFLAAHPAHRATVPAILRAWRGTALVIVVEDPDEHLWRITLRDGALGGEDLGPSKPWIAAANTLERDPRDAAAGERLGAAFLRDVPAGSRVAILALGRVAAAPIGALRIGGARAADRFVLGRALGILPRASTATHATAGPVVIGDPDGTLPDADREARDVAARLGGALFLGPSATKAALRSAAGASVLHVAAHSHFDIATTVLRLADGDADARTVAALDPPPVLAVLASCATGRAAELGNGSLAQAFVNAGVEVTIATQRSVRDDEAAALVARFYADGGATDPIRALARAQAESAAAEPPGATGYPTWAAFEAVIGRPLSAP